ncbi:uncharacterized protein LOC124442552 [Xenia sp. Carnegie-2017]|uniref:uncharacterized protein LOC124442552 n=1 Tax=Xenia sp. Carnegie-2017 TaxID=2897299 RepID=UPI001F046B8E|nr:uncharacterized protein LOC124442552 [Xenia sp. Carnegie-2017]
MRSNSKRIISSKQSSTEDIRKKTGALLVYSVASLLYLQRTRKITAMKSFWVVLYLLILCALVNMERYKRLKRRPIIIKSLLEKTYKVNANPILCGYINDVPYFCPRTLLSLKCCPKYEVSRLIDYGCCPWLDGVCCPDGGCCPAHFICLHDRCIMPLNSTHV